MSENRICEESDNGVLERTFTSVIRVLSFTITTVRVCPGKRNLFRDGVCILQVIDIPMPGTREGDEIDVV